MLIRQKVPEREKDGRNWYSYCENDPPNRADPWGLAKIYIALRMVAYFGNHAYLIIEDEETGELWTIGGGPTGEWEPWRQRLENKSGPGGTGNYEGVGNGIPSGAVLIKDDDRAGEWWYNAANSAGEEIEAREIGYWFATTNSNAFLYAVLERCGLLDEWNAASGGIVGGFIDPNAGGRGEWAPGWGHKLFDW